MNRNKNTLNMILYTVIVIVIIALVIKVSVFVLKIVLAVGLVYYVYKIIKKGIHNTKQTVEQRKREKQDHYVNKDGIVDVKYEEEE